MNNLIETQWYRDLVQRCTNEPDKIHSAYIENAFLSDEEFDQLLNNLISQLDLIPENAQVFVKRNENMIDITMYREPKMSDEEKANFLRQAEDRFKKIELPDQMESFRSKK